MLWGTRGGPTRVRLLRAIISKPMNSNQLAKDLGMDYTTVRHHLGILLKNGVLEAVGEKYGVIFYLSKWLTQKIELVREMLDESRKK